MFFHKGMDLITFTFIPHNPGDLLVTKWFIGDVFLVFFVDTGREISKTNFFMGAGVTDVPR